MQKVLRRTALAKSQAKRKQRITAEQQTIRDKIAYRLGTNMMERERLDAIREARQTRRDDWEMGPLAPWRDNPARNGTHGSYSMRFANSPPVPAAWRMKDCFFKVGDRVCVVTGREGVKGKIGKIRRLDMKEETARIDGVSQIVIRVPSSIAQTGENPVNTVDEPVPLSSLRLVYPLPDSSTGIPRDCILTNLEKRNTRFDVYSNKTVWDRVLMPQNIRIPWPEANDPLPVDQACDTVRIDVETKTFLPTLLRPPMPPSVLDECRGRYSIFRDRHEEEWVAAKKAEDEEAGRVKTVGAGMLPKGARNVARGEGAGSAGGRFMESKRMRPREDDSNLEAVGAWMAERGLGPQQKQKKENKNDGLSAAQDIPLASVPLSQGQSQNSAPP